MSGGEISATISGGVVINLTITNAGSGYSVAPVIYIDPPANALGTRALATCTVSGGSIVTVTMGTN